MMYYAAQDLAQISLPVVIVQSELDEFIKPEHAAYLARTIPKAELINLQGVSHFAPWPRPEQFNRTMLAFLGDVLACSRKAGHSFSRLGFIPLFDNGKKQMRDKRYIANHRGGPLSIERHRLLAAWAADCAERVLSLFCDQYPEDDRPQRAIETARAWSRGEITVGEARAASVAAHAAAREADEGAARFVARAAGHAVATAHMADHAPGAAMYALKAVKAAMSKQNDDTVIEQEHQWQKERLPEEIRELVLSTFAQKFASLK